MERPERMRLLLVEDSDSDARLVERSCRRMFDTQYELELAQSMEGALAALERARFDLVLLDLHLADSRGIPTLERMRTVVSHVPIVVLTSDDSSWRDAMRAGAQDYLAKDDLSAGRLERTIHHAVERHRLLSIVARSERMASVGQLSAGIAHELNSPLAQILAELGELRSSGSSPASNQDELLDRVVGRVEQIRSTVEALYSFSTAQSGRQENFEASESVLLARRLADNHLRHVARVEEDVQPLGRVYGDPGRVTQAVLDLLNHAAEVASNRGRSGRVWFETGVRDGEAVVTVEDDGPGVPANQRQRLLEPFGAARTVSASGVGLAAALEVAKAHGGALDVLPGRHGGVRFEFRLPLLEAAPTHISSAARSLPSPGGRARILWIDDDVNLLRAFRRRLRRDHDVEICTRAEDAAKLLESGEDFDVICCDLMMPRMNGRDFCAYLERCMPDLASRLVFITGGVFTEEERRFLERCPQPRLLKPFEWSAFLHVVDEVRAKVRAA
ncbi:MAG: response regulator [Myxococcota bacterium]